MKKIIIFLVFTLINISIFSKDTLRIGIYSGYFFPRDNMLKEIYKKEGVIYGFKLGVRVWKGLSLWLSGMQYQKIAETFPLGDRTKLILNPINLSIRYTFRLGRINPYVEGGYTYVFFKELSDIGDVESEGKGYSLDTGIEMKLASWFMIDIGVKYSSVEVNPTGFDVDIGGFQAGIALLLTF